MAVLDSLSDMKEVMLHNLQRAALWLQTVWDSFLGELLLVEASVKEKLMEWGVGLGQSASTFWTNLIQWITQ